MGDHMGWHGRGVLGVQGTRGAGGVDQPKGWCQGRPRVVSATVDQADSGLNFCRAAVPLVLCYISNLSTTPWSHQAWGLRVTAWSCWFQGSVSIFSCSICKYEFFIFDFFLFFVTWEIKFFIVIVKIRSGVRTSNGGRISEKVILLWEKKDPAPPPPPPGYWPDDSHSGSSYILEAFRFSQYG